MRKVYIKLIALSLTLALSVTMVVAASYAWLVLSRSPEVSGIQVTIGGGNTILVAADVTQTVNGQVYHYPDYFADTLNFSRHSSYAYLQTLDGLMPVSTADGIHWFLPTYYDGTDEEVKEGKALAGELKDISQFTMELDFAHANLSGVDEDVLAAGSYAYLDFWVVAPGADCTLRLSVPTVEGDNSSGTFLLDQPQGKLGADGYILESGEPHAAAMFRVGFLANPDTVTDSTMVYYINSPGYEEAFRSLRGNYGEPGSAEITRISNRFTIYEPNGDYHPNLEGMEGAYIPTYAIASTDNGVEAISVMDRVTVQKKSEWMPLSNGQTMLEQMFQTAMAGKNLEQEELSDYFYNRYLQGRVDPYVNKGVFYQRSGDLAAFAGTVSADVSLATAGATDDVYIIKLERNIPQRIRMFVWLEGQDPDCVNITQTSSLVLNLELAGSTQSDETNGT